MRGLLCHRAQYVTERVEDKKKKNRIAPIIGGEDEAGWLVGLLGWGGRWLVPRACVAVGVISLDHPAPARRAGAMTVTSGGPGCSVRSSSAARPSCGFAGSPGACGGPLPAGDCIPARGCGCCGSGLMASVVPGAGEQVPGAGEQLAGDRGSGDLLPGWRRSRRRWARIPVSAWRSCAASHRGPPQPGRALLGDVAVADGAVRAADGGGEPGPGGELGGPSRTG